MDTILRHLRRLTRQSQEHCLSDGQLLGVFLERRDETAFEALVRRLGPLVLGVCRRVLRNEADVEDAFQATFVVLFRQASAVRAREKVGAWLYGVAYRTAMKARAMSAKRLTKERQAAGSASAGAAPDQELLCRLDEELGRLPEKYREALVLCELEGKSRREAARILGIPEGTLSSRLATGRHLLARRMARHGAALSAGAMALAQPATAGVAVPLVDSTVRATAGVMSAPVAALVNGVIKTMLLTKLKVVTLAGLMTLSVCVMAFAQRGGPGAGVEAQAPKALQAPKAARAADDLEALRLEIEALRLELKATRERVKRLEDAATAKPKAAPGGLPAGAPPGVNEPAAPKAEVDPTVPAPAPKGAPSQNAPFAPRQAAVERAEAALRKLRESPNDGQALHALEQALQQMRAPTRFAPPQPK